MGTTALNSIIVWTCIFLLSACGGGGGGGGGGTPAPVGDQDFGGVWSGSWTVDGGPANEQQDVVGLSTDEGAFEFLLPELGIRASGTVVSIDGTTVQASGLAYTIEPGDSFPGGATITGFSFTGTLSERNQLTGEWSIDAGDTGSFDLQYDTVHQRGADLARVAGLWDWLDPFLNPIAGPFDIAADGTVFRQAGGCDFIGAISVPDPAYNVYEWNVTISDTTPGSCPLAGTTPSKGLAVLGDSDVSAGPLNDWLVVFTSRENINAAALILQRF